MSSLATWWQDLQQTIAHPIDVFNSIITPSQSVSGPPGPQGDSVASAQVRAYGVDPLSGALVNPNYQYPPGYDPTRPMDFVNRVESDAVNFYQDQLNKNTASANSGVPSSLLLVGVGLVALLLFFKAVD